MSGSDFFKQCIGSRDGIGHPAMAAGCGDHGWLQAAFEGRGVYLWREFIRIYLKAAPGQGHCQRCGSALVFFLGEKRHRTQLMIGWNIDGGLAPLIGRYAGAPATND
jgi:hypothetical protein